MKKRIVQSRPISNCTFTGVHWDTQATDALITVAHALLNLTELFRSQNIHIESLLTIKEEKSDDTR